MEYMWHVFETINHTKKICGHDSEEEGKVCQTFNKATKAYILGREMPIILVLYYMIFNEDNKEMEPLIVD
eukprot:8984134-Ditylum_brightwellii.AAC.1